MNFLDRVSYCLNLPKLQKTKRNKLIKATQITSEVRELFIERWFSNSITILDAAELKKDFSRILFLRELDPNIQSITDSVIALAISCWAVERYGIGTINKFWLKGFLMEFIEQERLGLTIGNLTFYNELIKEQGHSELVSGYLIKKVYRRFLPINVKPDYSYLYHYLENQGILLKVSQTKKGETFIFCSYLIRKALYNPINYAVLNSNRIAADYLNFHTLNSIKSKTFNEDLI